MLVAAEEPKSQSPQEQYQALVKEYEDDTKALQDAFKEAKTPAETEKIHQEMVHGESKLAAKFLDLAEKNPKDSAAIDALAWVLRHYSSATKEGRVAAEMVSKSDDHVKNDRIGLICLELQNDRWPAAEHLLRLVLEKNPHKDAQGMACYALALSLKVRASAPQAANVDRLNREAEQLLERVVKDFADVKIGPRSSVTLGDRARGVLFEARYLVVGKAAPEVEGEDIEGRKFKLSDYEGKVVLIDFWGNW
jgi:hypothetical protein